MNQVTMRNNNWVEILPPRPPAEDTDVISRPFFKPTTKTGELKFKTGKCQVYLHVPNEVYNNMERHREAHELELEQLEQEQEVRVCDFFSKRVRD